MELKAVVQYLGEWAHYAITPEENGIYNARLTRYEGADIISPPDNILLVRSARQWVGSDDEQDLLAELGRCIDELVREGNPHDR